jgi:ribose 5-phosphate isomerase B
MRIALGCDHRGLNLKQTIISIINEMGHSYDDFGCYDINPVDYPDIAQIVAEAVKEGKFSCGILICSTGIGMSIAANKVKGIRAALCHDPFTARRARQHNDASVLCLGEEVVGKDLAEEIVKVFLDTEFEGGRHTRRLEKITAIES